MAVTVELPPGVEQQLRAAFPDLERHLLEAWAVEGYRRGELTSRQVGEMLGLESRASTIHFLIARGVYPNYDREDFEQDMRNLEQLETRTPR